MAKVIRIPSAFVIETKVVGVSHTNPDGTSRQEIIRSSVDEGDAMDLVPEPENPYDPDAVKVVTKEGKQVGYLNKEIAPQIKQAIENETTIYTRVSWVGEREMKGVGLRIELVN